MTCHWIVLNSNTTDANSGAGTVYSPGAPEFTTVFVEFHISQYLDFSRLSCLSLFVFFFLFVIVLVCCPLYIYGFCFLSFGIFKFFWTSDI